MKLGRCGNVLDGAFGALVCTNRRNAFSDQRCNRNAAIQEGQELLCRFKNMLGICACFVKIDRSIQRCDADFKIVSHIFSLRGQKRKEREKARAHVYVYH